jgi:hypothetical protein
MEIEQYDPSEAPDAEKWLAMDEAERIAMALDYHIRAGIELPRLEAHALLHVTVENQIALGDETPVRLKLRHLMAQGLNRHDAIHAIASVLIKFLNELMRDPSAVGDPNRRYYSDLRRLNARKWLRSG